MTTEKNTAAEAPTSRETKFFGLKTSIDDMLPKKSKADEDDVIIIEDADEEIATPDKPALKKGAEEEGATDSDIEQASEAVQKRINKLTYQFREAERQRNSVQAERDEAYRIAGQLHKQTQQQANLISTGEARLVDEIKNRAALGVEQARNLYAKAHEEGDTAAVIAAQEAMITAKHQNEAANAYGAEYQQRVNQWAAQQQQRQQQPQRQYRQPQQQQQKPRTADPEALDWTKKNPWFGKDEHRDMTALAYAEHEKIVKDEGIQPNSGEYYRRIDAKILHHFPEYFDRRQGGQPGTASSKPNVVVAPATRAGAKTRTVRLSATERAVAKGVGISEELYAKQLLKEKERG